MGVVSRHWKHVAAGTAVPLVLLGIGNLGAGASGRSGAEHHSTHSYEVRTLLSGSALTHTFTPSGGTGTTSAPLTNPDDITSLGGDIFVAFQNGVGPQGQASTADGNLDSTVVALRTNGAVVAQWDLKGKIDGLTADPAIGAVIATVNEDANSSLYTIDPAAPPADQVVAYAYNEALPHDGGTDAISIANGQILISASAPATTGTPPANAPAVYKVSLDAATKIATVTSLFADNDPAAVANLNSPQHGQSQTLALTDPDSSEIVPNGTRFAGDFVLTSQGDLEQIYVSNPGSATQRLAVLTLTQAVDDTAWPTSREGVLYSTDSTNDAVDAISGPFARGQALVVATPCGSNSAPGTCPAPPTWPANYLATLDTATGTVTAVTTTGAAYVPQGGLLYLAHPSSHDNGLGDGSGDGHAHRTHGGRRGGND